MGYPAKSLETDNNLKLKITYNQLITRFKKAEDFFKNMPEDYPADKLSKAEAEFEKILKEISRIYYLIDETVDDVYVGFRI